MKHIIITGHYGSGKSNIAVNLALNSVGGKPVYLIDADIVNPYFRSLDNKSTLEAKGVKVLAPMYANTNLDVPSLPAEIQQVFARDCIAIWDIGGDEAGATVLGRYAEDISKQGYEMLYVVNFFRPLSENNSDSLSLMKDIERTSTLKLTSIINNSNLGDETTADDICNSTAKAEELSALSGLPIKATTVASNIEIASDKIKNLIKIDILTKCYW